MSVLITGGSGLIGTTLADILLQEGQSVLLFDLESDEDRIEPLRARFGSQLTVVLGDVLMFGELAAVMKRERVHAVAHLAGLLGVECSANPQLGTAVNVVGTQNLLELSRLLEVERIVLASSTSVYGLDESYREVDLPLTERAPALGSPGHPIYAGSKMYMEKLAEHYRGEYGLSAVGIRPSTVYSPERRTGTFTAISDMITSAALGRPATIAWGDTLTSLVYVSDVAAQLAALLAAPANAFDEVPFFNSGGDTCTMEELADVVKRVVPDARIELGRGAIPHAGAISDRAMVEHVGYTRKFTPLETGVRAHIEAARAKWGGR